MYTGGRKKQASGGSVSKRHVRPPFNKCRAPAEQIEEEKKLTVGQRVDLGVSLLLNAAKARERVDTVNVHGAGPADAFPARPPERQRRVHFVLDLDESIEDHGAAGIEVDLVRLQVRLLCRLIRVPAVDLEVLEVLRLGGGRACLHLGGRGKGAGRRRRERLCGCRGEGATRRRGRCPHRAQRGRCQEGHVDQRGCQKWWGKGQGRWWNKQRWQAGARLCREAQRQRLS